MSIQIDWIDRNASVDSFKIYRSSAPILESALPAVLATVPGNVFTYLDTTAPRNTIFHYRIAAVVGTVETLSANRALANIPYNGPGPQKLTRGDYLFGLYGAMNIEDLFSTADFCRLMGWPGSLGSASAKVWIKYIVNGKVMFTPDTAICSMVPGGMKGLYALGAVYGNDPTNTHMPALTATAGVVPQKCTLTVGEHQFLARLPGSRVGPPPATYTDAGAVGGEWDQYISSMFQNRLATATVPQMSDYTHLTNQYMYTKDAQTASSTIVVCRGGPSWADSVYTAGLDVNAGAVGSHWYKPVLELLM